MGTPFFWVNSAQFWDTFNNNFFRTALTSFIIFEMSSLAPTLRSSLAAVAVALLMLPAFLVSALAGELADKYPKDRVIGIICLCQFFFVLLGCIGFKWALLPCLFVALLGMGAGGSMLSPVKYSILPEILPSHKLLLANGLMQAAVYMAILGGTILGGMIFSLPSYCLYGILLAAGVLTYVCSLFILPQKASNPQVRVDVNFLRSTFKNMAFAVYDRHIFICILAISWFWGIGTVVLSLIPTLVTFLGGEDSLFTLFIALFSCGIGVGSLLCQLLLRGHISAKYTLISLLGVVVCLGYLMFLCQSAPSVPGSPLGVFLQTNYGWQIVLALFVFAVCGGIYIVPLVSLLQMLAPADNRARIVAANNIVNALFMVIGSLFCSFLLWKQIPLWVLLGVLSLANIPVAFYIFAALKKIRRPDVP